MNITFLIEDSELNNLKSVEAVCERIISSLQGNNCGILNNNKNIYKLTKNNKEIFIECYKFSESTKYFVNIMDICEDEKNSFVELISSDKLYKNSIVVFDSLSNNFISKEFSNFMSFEINIKQYFSLKLLQNYGIKAYDIIGGIQTKDNILNLNDNIKTGLQHIELMTLIEYMIDKPLGGVEYEEYIKLYDCNDLNKLKKKLNESIFDDIVKELRENKSIIKEYRNVICHNRILNCNEMVHRHCNSIHALLCKIKAINNDILQGIYKKDVSIKGWQVLNFVIKHKNSEKEIKLILTEILLKLGIVYIDKNSTIIGDDNIGYKTDDEYIQINLSRISEEIDGDLCVIYITYNNIIKKYKNISKTILNEFNQYDIIVLYDSQSAEYCNQLAKQFNTLENTFRKYITIFKYLKTEEQNFEKDKMPYGLSIGINEKICNSIYDLDFIELLNIIRVPNGGKNLEELAKKLRTLIAQKKCDEIEFLLTNMVEYNNDLKVIVKHWSELYRVRTIVAHCGIIQSEDYNRISKIIKFTQSTIEDVIQEYINDNIDSFKYIKKAKKFDDFMVIEPNIEKSNLHCCNIIFYKDNGKSKQEYRIEGIYPFMVMKILDGILDISGSTYILSYEYIYHIIKNNICKIQNFVCKTTFQEELYSILKELQLDSYASFRSITTEEQELEYRIGELLNNLEDKLRNMDKR